MDEVDLDPRTGLPRHRLLGQQLIAAGLLDPAELRRILEEQQMLPEDESVRRLGSLLVRTGRLNLQQIAEALGQQRGVMTCSDAPLRVSPEVNGIFPRELLHEIGAVPLGLAGETLVVAMVDPHKREHVARLQKRTRYALRPVIAPQVRVHALLTAMGPPPSRASLGGPAPRPPEEDPPLPERRAWSLDLVLLIALGATPLMIYLAGILAGL